MAPSAEHIKRILAKLEDVLSAYDIDCERQLAEAKRRASQCQLTETSSAAKTQILPPPVATPNQSLPIRQAVQTPLQSSTLATPASRSGGGGGAFSRLKRKRGLLGRLLRQCLPVGAGGGGSDSAGKPKIQVPLGWASAVTFNWRRSGSNSAASTSTASASIGPTDQRTSRLQKQLKRIGGGRGGLGIRPEPVVLIGRRARHSTVLMARARRLRRSLPAKLRRQLEGLGDDEGEEEVEEDEEAAGAAVKEQILADLAPASVAASSIETTQPDVIENSVTDEGDANAGVQDSEQVSVILATPQRRELDAEVRKIEEEIKNVRQQLEQPDSESPMIQATPSPPSRRLLVTSSGLDPSEVAQLRRLCEDHAACCSYQARFQFDPECHTTHVVIRESSAARVSERTLKYFQALVSGAWLVSFDWVSESLAAGSLLPESDYEIQGDLSCGVNHMGPARSRRGRARCPGPSRLLEQFSIAPVGEFINMPTFALQTLVQQSGGQFVAEPESLPRRQPLGRLSVAVADQDDARFSESRCRSLAASGDVIVLNRDWLLDSISKFRVQQLHSAEYCIFPDSSVVMDILARQKIRFPAFDDF